MSASSRARRLRERLGQRDIAILKSLREFRLMSGNQLRRLHFPGENRTTQSRKMRAAITRLAGLKLVARAARRIGGIRAGSEGYIIGLTGLGQTVANIGTGRTTRRRSFIHTKLAFQAHVLAVAELVVHLHERERAGFCEIDELTAEPGCWRRFSGIGGNIVTLKPDAYVRLGVGEYELAAFIEQDMATESLPTIIRKLSVYVSYWRSGQEQRERGVFPRVWWLVPDVARLTAIEAAIRRLATEARALFAVVLTSEAPDRLIQLPETGGRL